MLDQTLLELLQMDEPHRSKLIQAAAAEAWPEIGDVVAVSNAMVGVNAALRRQTDLAETDPHAPHARVLLKQIETFPRCGCHQGAIMIPHVRRCVVRSAHRLPSGSLCYGGPPSRHTQAVSRPVGLAMSHPAVAAEIPVSATDANDFALYWDWITVSVSQVVDTDVRRTMAFYIVIPLLPLLFVLFGVEPAVPVGSAFALGCLALVGLIYEFGFGALTPLEPEPDLQMED